MPKTRPAYPPEYREQIVALARAGRGPEELAVEFEPSAQTIRTWIAQDQVDTGQRPGLTSEEKTELARLRRENKQLREEREILRKATLVRFNRSWPWAELLSGAIDRLRLLAAPT